jgi:hypothetical protein
MTNAKHSGGPGDVAGQAGRTTRATALYNGITGKVIGTLSAGSTVRANGAPTAPMAAFHTGLFGPGGVVPKLVGVNTHDAVTGTSSSGIIDPNAVAWASPHPAAPAHPAATPHASVAPTYVQPQHAPTQYTAPQYSQSLLPSSPQAQPYAPQPYAPQPPQYAPQPAPYGQSPMMAPPMMAPPMASPMMPYGPPPPYPPVAPSSDLSQGTAATDGSSATDPNAPPDPSAAPAAPTPATPTPAAPVAATTTAPTDGSWVPFAAGGAVLVVLGIVYAATRSTPEGS